MNSRITRAIWHERALTVGLLLGGGYLHWRGMPVEDAAIFVAVWLLNAVFAVMTTELVKRQERR